MKELDSLLAGLKASPHDWNIRIEAVEFLVRAGDKEGARRLVREDTSDEVNSHEIQWRLHTALTKGLPPLPHETFGEDSAEPLDELVENPHRESELVEGAKEDHRKDFETKLKPEPDPERKEMETPGGGLTALVEDAGPIAVASLPVTKAVREAPVIRWEAAVERWRNYDGGLNLVEGGRDLLPERSSLAPERISSIGVAALVHAVLFFLIGLAVIEIPREKPPQIVVSVVHERPLDIVTPKMVRPSVEVSPSAAAASAINVITSINESRFSVPDLDHSTGAIVNAMLPGIQPLGQGKSFSTDATKSSDVNFFGISGSGNKMVFVIDATREMLVDEKGGMTAFDNVKDEVGVMLTTLNRNTHFNILLYEGKRLISFRDELVPGLPSNVRLALEWLAPLNTDYAQLGLPRAFGASLSVSDHEKLELQAADVAHYSKAIHKAMEWGAASIFCITSGYGEMRRSLTPEMRKELMENPPTPGTPGKIDPGEAKRWNDAVAKTRAWLNEENAARREKGISPKVVVNFNRLVQSRTGATPPRRRGGTPASGGAMPNLPPVTAGDIEEHIETLVKLKYEEAGLDEPGVHMVVFLGEDERIDNAEDHFRRLTRQNGGKLKILRGLASLNDVTSGKD
ncbi:MAG: hypothetical protein P1U86_15390 [Verrucomicrobiales bacterium]|nr:hypothetical protein [Verrucomicrobiales bacterium]